MNSWIKGLLVVLFGALICSGLTLKAEQMTNLDTLARSFVTALTQGNYAEAYGQLNGTMQTAMPEESLRTTWTSLTTQVGAFQRVLRTRQESVTENGHNFTIIYITSRFAQMAIDVKVVFDAQQKIGGLWFMPAAPIVEYQPPVYADMKRFSEESVTIGAGPTALPGTLTMPKGKGPFPAIVLVHGSGPNDRDESVGANKPFRDLAYGLATNGLAVLRYDKRTRVHPAQFANAVFTVKEETIDDALAAVTLLRTNPRIDSSRTFVLGHSLGGMLIPRIGLADKRIAGLVILAGATMPLGDTILRQLHYIASAKGAITPEFQQQIDAVAGQLTRVNALQSADATSCELILGAPPAYWLDLRDYHPAEEATKLSCPLLILQGERDYQVTPADNFTHWQDALHGHQQVTFHLYPRLNHLFIAGEGLSLPAEYDQPGHVDEQVIKDIAGWVSKEVK